MTIESGKITSWKDDKGFGFITPKSGGKAIFIHISDFSRKHQSPIKGLEVQYLSKRSINPTCSNMARHEIFDVVL